MAATHLMFLTLCLMSTVSLASTVFNVTGLTFKFSDAIDSLPLGPRQLPKFAVATANVSDHGFLCTDYSINKAIVYYPTDSSKKFPLITFAHGFSSGGVYAHEDYADLLPGVAAWGFIVIVVEDGGEVEWCEKQYLDQLHAIDVLKANPLGSRVDWTKKVGIMGHSMGGHSTVRLASTPGLEKYNLGAAVALHPCAHPGVTTSPLIPTFYGTGSLDDVCLPEIIWQMYQTTPTSGKVFAEITGATHLEPLTGHPDRWMNYAAIYFACHLNGLPEACDTIYGYNAGTCDLCVCYLVPMTVCVHTSVAGNDTVLV